MKVLVTGGAGFIGSHIVDALIERNHHVVIIDNLSTGNRQNLNPQAKFYNIDLADSLLISGLFEQYDFDCVFHFAAQINLRRSIIDPGMDAKTNIVGTINLLNHCKKGVQFIFASTGGAIYAPDYAKIPWTEDSITDPQSPYGLSKLCAEKYIKLISDQREFNHTILRLSNVYGPRQNAHGEAGIIAIFKNKILNSELCTIFGDGNQTRDFIYVKDVMAAFITAMESNIHGTFNVATGSEVSINNLTNNIFRVLNIEPNIKYEKKIDGEMERSCLSYKKLNQAVGWVPQHTLNVGLAETLKK